MPAVALRHCLPGWLQWHCAGGVLLRSGITCLDGFNGVVHTAREPAGVDQRIDGQRARAALLWHLLGRGVGLSTVQGIPHDRNRTLSSASHMARIPRFREGKCARTS